LSEINKISCTAADFAGLSAELLRLGKVVRFQARGNSMQPLLRDGDILSVSPVDHDQIRVGDVLMCSSQQNFIVVHRVISKQTKFKECRFLVKGDHAEKPDGWIQASQVYGRIIAFERQGKKIGLETLTMKTLGLMVVFNSHRAIGRMVTSHGTIQRLKKHRLFYWYLF